MTPPRRHGIDLSIGLYNLVCEGDKMAATEFAVPAAERPSLENMDDPQTRADDCALGPHRRIPILSVSPDEKDHNALLEIVDELPFLLTSAWTCQEAARYLDMEAFGIVLCECKLPDGNWVEILNRTSRALNQPLLIVTSRLADVSLWAEVLNLGGYDLLAKPFNRQEVRHVLTSAWVQRENPVGRTCVAGAA
jgi:PleD family two-component response regulator